MVKFLFVEAQEDSEKIASFNQSQKSQLIGTAFLVTTVFLLLFMSCCVCIQIERWEDFLSYLDFIHGLVHSILDM